MDGDLLSIKPEWVETISNPIVYGRADLTVPYYIRDKNDGVITNNLVYPFTRALYGIWYRYFYFDGCCCRRNVCKRRFILSKNT